MGNYGFISLDQDADGVKRRRANEPSDPAGQFHGYGPADR